MTDRAGTPATGRHRRRQRNGQRRRDQRARGTWTGGPGPKAPRRPRRRLQAALTTGGQPTAGDSAPRSWSPSTNATSWTASNTPPPRDPATAPGHGDRHRQQRKRRRGGRVGRGRLRGSLASPASRHRLIHLHRPGQRRHHPENRLRRRHHPRFLGSEGRILDIGRTRIFPPHSAKPSPPATRAARSPAAPFRHPGAKPTTSLTGHTADPPAPITEPSCAPITTISSTKNIGHSK